MDKKLILVNELLTIFNNDNVIGSFLSGSLADDSYDMYSDVDIRFLVETNDIEKYTLKEKGKLTSNEELLSITKKPPGYNPRRFIFLIASIRQSRNTGAYRCIYRLRTVADCLSASLHLLCLSNTPAPQVLQAYLFCAKHISSG